MDSNNPKNLNATLVPVAAGEQVNPQRALVAIFNPAELES